ncbi:ABC transporter ATP-binding protein [Acetonema longum]|uniref:ABC transporter ATPase n=1 Tax=Acetonema longum DSM 6540 TaxID=1009370 RepID=F7NDT6_9FIRM|nr:ABC transporter ATP-binding protein [Acetonema longum]EGO65807.1 ABC transporter ATPase [Acetonema longum DSM 6540]
MREQNVTGMTVEIKALSKTYRKNNGTVFTAVDNVNLAIHRGEVFGFLGANGAGKTTTIKMMCGLVAPTSGRILLNGCDTGPERGNAMRQIGVVLEGTRNIYWPLSAWQNLMYFGRLKGCSGRALNERSEQLLRELELWDRRNDIVRNFSRGMQQRIAIACALIADPPILILDEPTLGLDVEATQIMKALLQRLAREYQKTVIITSHQLDVVQELCDRVAIIHKGRIIADRSLAELLALFGQGCYQIKAKGNFANLEKNLPGDFSVTEENGTVLLTGPISSQAELYGLLLKIREQGMTLIAASPIEPDLEEVFLKLVKNKGGEGQRWRHAKLC